MREREREREKYVQKNSTLHNCLEFFEIVTILLREIGIEVDSFLISLPVSFDEIITIVFLRGGVGHCFRFMDGYRKDLTGPVLEYAVKKYKSQRRLSSSLQLEKVEKECLMKQKTMMKFL